MREEDNQEKQGCDCRYCWLEIGVVNRTISCILLIGISGPIYGAGAFSHLRNLLTLANTTGIVLFSKWCYREKYRDSEGHTKYRDYYNTTVRYEVDGVDYIYKSDCNDITEYDFGDKYPILYYPNDPSIAASRELAHVIIMSVLFLPPLLIGIYLLLEMILCRSRCICCKSREQILFPERFARHSHTKCEYICCKSREQRVRVPERFARHSHTICEYICCKSRKTKLLFPEGFSHHSNVKHRCDSADSIRKLPTDIEELEINMSIPPSGSAIIDSLIEFMNKEEVHLKKLHIFSICVANGENPDEGRDCGRRLSTAIASHDSLEYLDISSTDLIGSRNVNAWIVAFLNSISLRCLYLGGMSHYCDRIKHRDSQKSIASIDIDNESPYSTFSRQLLHNEDRQIFPDAMLTKSQYLKLKESSSALLGICGFLRNEYLNEEEV